MSNLTLGIDLGTNSIGWAIRDITAPENQIIKSGVLIFDKGVGEEKGIEFPKVKKRTESRGKRRNYQAEKYRKWALLEFLIEQKMCPLTIDELDKWRKYEKGKKRRYPQTERFVNWLRYDFNGDGKPDFHLFGGDKHESHYLFRVKAVSESSEDKNIFEKNREVLGRIFYHLVQQRGFRGRDEEEAKTMLEGSEKNNTPGRNKISEYIEKHKTLGAALYYYQKDKSEDSKKVRIRQRYNLRKDYENELKEICRVQGLDGKFYNKLHKAIIWQRELRTQKGLVGLDTHQKNKRRAPISHPLYEEYRTWVFINNLKIEAPEGWQQAKYLEEKIYPLFYKTGNDFSLSTILKQLESDNANITSKFATKGKTKVLSAKLLRQFEDILGNNWKENHNWNALFIRDAQPPKKQSKQYTIEDIWHVLLTFDSEEKLKEFAEEKLGLAEEKAIKFSKIRLPQGYATLSLSSIKKIIPYLKKGFIYSKAVYMANLRQVLGTHEVSEDFIKRLADEIDEIYKNASTEKDLNNVLNSLFREELVAEGDYHLPENKDLDESDIQLIQKKIKDVLGDKTWRETTDEEKKQYLDYVKKHFKEFLQKPFQAKKGSFMEQPRIHQRIFNYLQAHYQVPDENIKHLWHPSEQEKCRNAADYVEVKYQQNTFYIEESKLDKFLQNNPDAETNGISLKLLGNPEPVSKGFKNPMALKTLHKLKQLLNYLLQTGQIAAHTRIVLEIARELNNTNYRKALEKWQNEREKENQKFKKTIEEINSENGSNYNSEDKNLIKRIRLWEEQGRKCMYTGAQIKACDVLNGEHYDIEHTIPASISFDNELKNLTIADKTFNSTIKGKRFPTQLDNYETTSTYNGKEIQLIIKNIEAIFGKRTIEKVKNKRTKKETFVVKWSKITDLENQFDDYLKRTKYASTKDIKDYYIQKRHLIKFDLDYLKQKLQTFTVEEYKASWRNSQLRDTQIMTKYAIPYLKTVFNRVEVQKGEVVDIFKEVYKVKLRGEKKDRSKHSHHAGDAGILTLIPKPAHRDRIIKEYQLRKDEGFGEVYHENPIGWDNFKASFIINIEEEILINNLKEYRTLTPTFKKVRKRGKIQYKENGKPKWAKGDTIRGQLHGESLYGAVKQPKRDKNNKIIFDDNQKMLLEDDIKLVIRKPLVYAKDAASPGFKNLAEIEKSIVDQALFKIIEKKVKEVGSLKAALDEENGIYMLNKNGEKVNKIRHIRCFDRLKYTTAIKPHEHDFISDKEYKRTTYAQNGENVYCLYYKKMVKGNEERFINIIGIFDLANSNIKDESEFFKIPLFNATEKKKTQIPLYAVLKSGQKAIFYKENPEELKELSQDELSTRLYKIYQFEGDGRIKLKHHLISGSDTDIKKKYGEASSMDFEKYIPLLRITSKSWDFALEGKDFEMALDGTITFKF